MDISNWIDRHAGFTPDKTAIWFEGEDISYAAMADRVGKRAAMLASLGVKKGDRVAYLGFNSPEFLTMLFSCARLGAMIVPMNWRLTPAEHLPQIQDCAPQVLFVEPEHIENVDSIRDGSDVPHYVAMKDGGGGWESFSDLANCVAEGIFESQGATLSDPVLISYTSGSTGEPKGVVLTQEALLFNAINSLHAHDMVNEDIILTNLPQFHVGGLNIMTTPGFHIGASIILQPQFDPDAAFDAIEQHKCTLAIFVPAIMAVAVNHPRWKTADLSSLRMIDTGSTFVADKLVRSFHERDIPVGAIYGLTETSPVAVYLTRQDADRKVGSTGKVALHNEMRIIDDDGNDVEQGVSGEILLRGPNVTKEYWNKPDITAAAIRDGWFYTGDMGYQDEDDFLFVNDRKKDMVISGGENIYPGELENILAECTDLAEAAVVGKADDKWGEVPIVVTVAKDPGKIKESDVLALFDGKLARYKLPKGVMFVETLPRNAMGKILKNDIREMVKE